MIQEYVDRFMARKADLEAVFAEQHPSSYRAIVEAVARLVTSGEYDDIDSNRIHQIDDGDYQGTLLFIIAGKGYQPDSYWYVKVGYGSCSGCDTLQAINDYSDDKPSPEQVRDYMTLALHIVQGLKKMS